MTTRRRGARRRVVTATFGLVGLGLTLAFAVLWSIGDPPSLGIDRLWVRDRRDAVMLMLGGVGVALAATAVAAAVARRGRWRLVLVWLAFVGISAVLFPDRSLTIVQVVLGRLGVG
jgi:hypothetical protein